MSASSPVSLPNLSQMLGQAGMLTHARLVVSTVMSGLLFARFPIVDYVTQL